MTQLEVLRQFAAAELAQAPEADAVRRRHAEHYLALGERLAPPVRVAGRGPAVEETERELGNLRAALDHWIAAGDGDRALLLAAALEPYWNANCRQRDGAAMLDAALALEPARASGRAAGHGSPARSSCARSACTRASPTPTPRSS